MLHEKIKRAEKRISSSIFKHRKFKRSKFN
jgi:hypothetical protein